MLHNRPSFAESLRGMKCKSRYESEHRFCQRIAPADEHVGAKPLGDSDSVLRGGLKGYEGERGFAESGTGRLKPPGAHDEPACGHTTHELQKLSSTAMRVITLFHNEAIG